MSLFSINRTNESSLYWNKVEEFNKYLLLHYKVDNPVVLSLEDMAHDCRDTNACGFSITSYTIDNDSIRFYNNNGREISSIPKIQSTHAVQRYHNTLYQSTGSKNFDETPTRIEDVLPDHFTVQYKGVDFIVSHDHLTDIEKKQIRKDIKSAYEVFKEKFCIGTKCYQIYDGAYEFCDRKIEIYVFNNGNDYKEYGSLLNFAQHNELDKSVGITNGKKILCYRYDDMDCTLAHELGHVFQKRFTAQAVETLESDEKVEVLKDAGHKFTASEFIANVIGQEVARKNSEEKIEDIKDNSSNDSGVNDSGVEDNILTEILCCFIGLIALIFFWWNTNDDGSASHYVEQLYGEQPLYESLSDDLI